MSIDWQSAYKQVQKISREDLLEEKKKRRWLLKASKAVIKFLK